MAISRAVRPMAMVTRAGAEYPVDTADRAAHRAAGDSAKWTGGGIAFRAPHSSNNALSMNRDRHGEQTRNRGNLQNFKRRPSPKVPWPGRGRNPLCRALAVASRGAPSRLLSFAGNVRRARWIVREPITT
jgi:hypothetical protein